MNEQFATITKSKTAAALAANIPLLPSDLSNIYTETLLRSDLRFRDFPSKAREKLAQMTDDGAFRAKRALKPKAFIGVAEGDSWFDYLPAYLDLNPFSGDLLGELNDDREFHIFKTAKGGDTLQNMLFGPASNPGAQLKQTLAAISRYNPDFFMFSGGGNDVAGPELERFLYTSKTAPNPDLPIRKDVVNSILGKTFFEHYNYLIDEVKRVAPNIHIFTHGYDYAIPDGRAVINAPFGWHFVGPWLKPAFIKMGITEFATQQRVIDFLMETLNATLTKVAAKRKKDKVHYVKLMGTLTRSGSGYKRDWANELHPSGKGWRRLHKVFKKAMLDILRS